jgi:hypothetical protein
MQRILQNIEMTPLLTGNPAYQLTYGFNLAEHTHHQQRDV